MRRRRGSIRPTVRAPAPPDPTAIRPSFTRRTVRWSAVLRTAAEAISLLLRNHVIQTKDHHRNGVAKDLVVQGQALTRLVNPLVNYDGMSRGLTDDVLKLHGRQVK